jgi:hypothetical protein
MSAKKTKQSAPLEWLEASTAEEIGEALLAADPNKAASVVLYLAKRVGQEVDRVVTDTKRDLEEDPLKALGSILLRGIARR